LRRLVILTVSQSSEVYGLRIKSERYGLTQSVLGTDTAELSSMPRLDSSHTMQATPTAQQDLSLFLEPPANRVSGIVRLTGLLVSSELPSRRYQIQQSQTLRQRSTLLLSLRVAQRTTLLPLTTPASMTILLQRANSVI
jgi:hypothetical protein